MSSRTLISVLISTASLVNCAPLLSSARGEGQASVGNKVKAPPAGPELGSFGIDLAGMDRSVRPGNDFYSFVNGGWMKSTGIPADRPQYSMFDRVAVRNNERINGIIIGEPAISKVGALYRSFLDRSTVEANGLRSMQPLLDRVAAAKSGSDVAGLAAELNRLGVSAPFQVSIWPDEKDPDTYVIKLEQGGLGMPDRAYLLENQHIEKQKAYRGYLATLLKLTGEKAVEGRANAVFAFEQEMAQVHWSGLQNRDVDKTYNRRVPSDLQIMAPSFDWPSYLAELGVRGDHRLNVLQPSAITGMAAVLAKTPLPVVKDYIKLRLVDSFAHYMPDKFVDARFAFRGTVLSGTPANQPLEVRATRLVVNSLPDEVSRLYVARYFPPDAKAAAQVMVDNILKAFDERLQKLDWMTPPTRERARAKLANFTLKVGYPNRWVDYSSFEVRPADLLGNAMRSKRFELDRRVARLGKPVDRAEWQLPATIGDAYAYYTFNEVAVPAGIMQVPFFDPNADPAVNYGAVGVVIGHEMSHHFDDRGSQWDERGVINNWWAPADRAAFEAKADRLAEQFSKYEVRPGQFVNGKLTSGENIADLAGISLAYDAYRASLGGQNAPILEGYTGDQRFFLAYAQMWRKKTREDHFLQQMLTDVHAPYEARASIVRNLDAWYEAFDIQPSDALYVAPDRRIRIW